MTGIARPGRCRYRRIASQFADRHLYPAHSPVSDAQHLFSVGGQNQIDVAIGGVKVGKGFGDGVRMVDRQIDAAGTAAFMVVLRHRKAYRQVIDDRDHLTQMFRKQPVKQYLVAIVQRSQIDVSAQCIRQTPVLNVGALNLSRQRAHIGWNESGEAQGFAFFHCERSPFVELRGVQHGQAARSCLIPGASRRQMALRQRRQQRNHSLSHS